MAVAFSIYYKLEPKIMRYYEEADNMCIAFTMGLHAASAQKGKNVAEGTGYYLPRTELRFTVKMERHLIRRASLPFMPKIYEGEKRQHAAICYLPHVGT